MSESKSSSAAVRHFGADEVHNGKINLYACMKLP